MSFQDVWSINSILLSKETRHPLQEFWYDAISTVRRDVISPDDVTKIHSGLEKLEWQMRRTGLLLKKTSSTN